MRTETSTRSRVNSITLTVLFFAMVFTCLCLLVPVWQSSENNRMRSRLNAYQSEIDQREEVKMVLESEVAKKTTPEFFMAMADTNNISLQQISSQRGNRVASNW